MDRKTNIKPIFDGQFRLIIAFDDVLDEARLGKAVRLAFDAEPVIGCRFVERPLRPYWQRCNDLEKAFEFHLVGSSDQDKAVYDYLLAPLDPFEGPQVRVGLFRSDHDTLYIKICHIVADGGAGFEYLRLLAGIYRRLEKEPEYRPAVNLRGSRNSFQALRHAGLIKILSSCARISLSGPTWRFPSEGSGDLAPHFFIRRLGQERVRRIKSYAKEHGATMGDIVMTAYYRALFEAIDPPENVPLPILVPVNIRKYIPGGTAEGICSLTAGYFPEIARKKAEPFEETLARVHAVMERNKSRQEELGQLFLMELVFAPGYIVPRIVGPFLSNTLVIPTFSNIGVVDPGIADFGDVAVREIFPAGPLCMPPDFILGSHTFKGEMALTTNVYGTDADHARVESLFDTMIRELPGYEQVNVIRENVDATMPVREMIEAPMPEKYASDA